MNLKKKSAITMYNAFPKPTLIRQNYYFLFYPQIIFDKLSYKSQNKLPKTAQKKLKTRNIKLI